MRCINLDKSANQILEEQKRMFKEKLNELHHHDAREIDKVLGKPIVDTVITSPPYFNMKDYGYPNQIGFGQTYEQYLNDLKIVFKKVFDITKNTGSLWVIIDTFKQNESVVPLPFDFSNKLKEIGWKLQDIIIWNKNKTVPWSKKGQTKNKFEYILFFTKGREYKYNTDSVREYDTKFLKKWWIKYPERYNPKGKAPEEIWAYDIPTQGSWGNGYIKHFCPLPTDMIGRMINLTTHEGDVILDPFAGTGSVLVQALYMKRNYIGFELNSEYIKMFRKYLDKTFQSGRKNYSLLKNGIHDQDKFEKIILELRSLKYARLIRHKLAENFKNEIRAIYVKKLESKPTESHKIISVRYDILVKNETNIVEIKNEINELCNKPPFSKFGIAQKINFFKQKSIIEENYPNNLYAYKHNNTHNFSLEINKKDIFKEFLIISDIQASINEENFE
jgi:DNA modification methylase